MSVTANFQHCLEWPPPGTALRGPVLWLRGWTWATHDLRVVDIRIRQGEEHHAGIYGLPRTDLAKHFAAARSWLPAGFVVGVPVKDGLTTLVLEAQDEAGRWSHLQDIVVLIDPAGVLCPHIDGELTNLANGTQTCRGPHQPFHGHLDDPEPTPAMRHGQVAVFGWLLHECQKIVNVWASCDTYTLNHLDHGLSDGNLAAKVPHLPTAKKARLRGFVDTPVTLQQHACLRVYAELADGSVHLCFAQRVDPCPEQHQPVQKPVMPRELPILRLSPFPSGRPRRLLFVLRTLQPCDATDRALDIAHHLLAGSDWAIRIVCIDAGPRAETCASLGIPVQFLDPQVLYDAGDHAEVESALADLGRKIWWTHLDAVVVFDPLCYWAIRLARRAGCRVVFDITEDRPLQPQSGASAAVLELTRQAWKECSAVCYSSLAAATLLAPATGDRPGRIIPSWHSADAPVQVKASTSRRLLVAPIQPVPEQGAHLLLHSAAWLDRHHPQTASRWRLAVTRAIGTPVEHNTIRDYLFNQPSLMALEPVGWNDASGCINPSVSVPPIRAMLDAAAAGIPLMTLPTPTLREYFPDSEATFLPPDNPLAVAHALLDLDANPAGAMRRTGALQARVRRDHAPDRWLPLWQHLLETTVAHSA